MASNRSVRAATGVLLTALIGGAVPLSSEAVQTRNAPPQARQQSAPQGRLPGWNAERNAYFGDLHVHTKHSFDAYIFNVRGTPSDAYRFARGEAIGHAGGYQVRLSGGPLDFAAVTDHAEYIGAMEEANNPASPLSRLPVVQGLFSPEPAKIQEAFNRIVAGYQDNSLPHEFRTANLISRSWADIRDSAARYNAPGRFTTFVGYEYTSAPGNQNLHRNVIFRDGRTPPAPFSALESNDPENLWRAMDAWRAAGMESLAIPHNSNGSDGLMFDTVRRNGRPIDKVYAELRMRNEPLVEITQIKGTSETHPSLSPNDEWANFEIMERYIGVNKPVTRFKGGYVREALKDGLQLQQRQGFNPFKFGFIGSSDTHNAAPGSVEEPQHFGKVGRNDATPDLRGSAPPDGARTWAGVNMDPTLARARFQSWGSSGLAGVWAEENSRASIYAAMRRKETFATSGPRMRVRFFAGYDFPADLVQRPDLVRLAYARGVPMGGDLLPSGARAPSFLVWGVRDPHGGYLQRAQVVKGWIENGVAKERVFDVACSDGLPLNQITWRCPENGAGVNLKTCEPDRFKGDVELRTLWRDPTFDPRQRAFYYVRVVENPSCRWSTWDALRNGTPPHPRLSPTIMERAWSSPIWYEPVA